MARAESAPQKSTSVRSKIVPALQWVPLRVLEALAPAVAERWAAQQFFTPRRAHGGLTLPPGDAFTVRSGEYLLRAWSWGAGPAVLLVHGWEGHAAHLKGFVQPLTNRGFRAVAVDLPAHGLSSGRRASVLDFADAVCAVGDAVGPVHGVIAHSLGGASAALALRPGPRTDGVGGRRLTAGRVVLLAPPEGPALFVQGVAAQLGLSPERSAGIARRIRDLIGVDIADLTVPNFAPHMDLPLLLIHDPADRVVPWEHAVAISKAWPGARLRPAPRLGHRRILTDPQVIAEVVSFLSDSPVEE